MFSGTHSLQVWENQHVCDALNNFNMFPEQREYGDENYTIQCGKKRALVWSDPWNHVKSNAAYIVAHPETQT